MGFELTGQVQNLAIDFKTQKAVLTLLINEKRDAGVCFDNLHDAEKISVKIDKYREKRSLNANAYCFKLIDKLAQKTNIPKTDIYRAAIKEIGGNCEIVCVKNEAVKRLCEGWEHNGLGWQTDTLNSKIEGCTNVVLYYGSSTYDSKQMSDLIGYIVDECKAQGIETRTPAEIAEMIDLWGRER